ncbi:DUF4176 domain-containing protein [Priestia koreensis]|uniref:Cytoplasmic protein n=1 Tax=Priestia koreensis TaxID=284581 RepID=A0A0M0KWN4_9BACI|nr:DUF4176 domain-containing protein [Priestia koreensis]KOO43017.1 cytoplasmic protein [Priestia koreensis]MCM3003607.1 DUF4176 domain-containing protein [Priestia koreensis]
MSNLLLPNGSVVLLKGGEKKLVIYGRKQMSLEGDDEIFDYLAVPFPEGFINQEYTYVFNEEAIEHIIFKGYEDEDERNFQEFLEGVNQEKTQ